MGVVFLFGVLAVFLFAAGSNGDFVMSAESTEDEVEDDGCFTHRDVYYCPGDCLVQDQEEEYCPDGPDERPFLLYDMTENDRAKCNDGTTPAIHYREGLPGDHETEWIFRFEGGNACYDDISCAQRLEHSEEFVFLTAASGAIIYNDPEGGMLNGSPEKNPEWYDYNVVDLHYCSSDGWMGNASAADNDMSWDNWGGETPEEGGWYYRGYENIMGTFDQAKKDWDLESATRVLVTGFSAGCMGVLAVSEEVKAWFDENLPEAELFFLCDSGWFLSSFEEFGYMDCSSGLECPLETQMELGWDLWQPVVPQTCLDEGMSGPDCMVPENSHPTATTHGITFIQENSYDLMQTDLHTEGIFAAGDSNITDEYRISLAEYTVNSLLEKANSFTSSNCDNHDSTNRNWMYEILWDDKDLSHYLKDWMDNGNTYAVYDEWVTEDGEIGLKMNPTCPLALPAPHWHGAYDF